MLEHLTVCRSVCKPHQPSIEFPPYLPIYIIHYPAQLVKSVFYVCGFQSGFKGIFMPCVVLHTAFLSSFHKSKQKRVKIRMKHNTCCFTGHRRLPKDKISLIHNRLNEEIDNLVQQGVTDFISGGALAFDQMAASLVIAKKETGENIRLTASALCFTILAARLRQSHMRKKTGCAL